MNKTIVINWNILFSNKKFIYTTVTISILLLILWLYNYTNLFNPVKIKLYTYYTYNIIEKDAKDALTNVKKDLKEDFDKKMLELEKKYEQELIDTENKQQLIISKYKSHISKEYTISILKDENIKLNEISTLSFNNEFEDILSSDKEIKVDFSIIEKIRWSIQDNNVITNNIEIENKKIEEEKEKKVEPVTLEYKVKNKKWNILVLDKDKLEHVLPYGINFPSLFSYSKNGVNILPWYFDIHYGVDYKTRPAVYLSFFFFKNKEWKVLISDYSKHWNKLVIGSEETGERFEYLHLDSMSVKTGENIKAWQKIAVTWKSWYITGPHLHFVYYKDWFFVPYDWGVDVDNKSVLLEMWFSQSESEEIVNLWKWSTVNMEHVAFIYKSINDKKISDIKLIKDVVIDLESKNKYSLYDIVSDNRISEKFGDKTDKIVVKNVIKLGDEFRTIKKKQIMSYLLDNKKDLEKYIAFDRNDLWPAYNTENKKEIAKKENFNNINFGKCDSYFSKTYEDYNNVLNGKFPSYITSDMTNNINHILPLILDEIEKNNISGQLMEQYPEYNFNDCDFLFLELWKWYNESTFWLNVSNNNGIFQNMSKNYNEEFPYDKWKNKLSENNYRKQISDSLNHSLWKMIYIKKLNRFKDLEYNKDYLLKFWLWAYHWLTNDWPNKDYYVVNNLFETNMPLTDISATRETAIKDGGYTLALKFYLNK